ncbi:MAG: DUF1893 domain-containing protein [Christensenellales bacterium]
MLTDNLTLAKQTLDLGKFTCVVVKDGNVLHRIQGVGVRPLLHLYQTHPQDLKGASVADKIIGKAAAVVLVLAGIHEAFGHVLSTPGSDFLKQHAIPAYGSQTVPQILNRSGDGICPLEQSVITCTDAKEGYRLLLSKVEQLMQNKA